MPALINPLGAAGVAGALVYLVLRFGISPQATLLIQTFSPIVMLLTYFFVLGQPGTILPTEVEDQRHGESEITAHVQGDEENKSLLEAEEEKEDEEEPFPLPVREDREKKGFRVKLFNREELGYWWSHVKYIRHLLFPYMVPLFGVYIAEYMINQGLYELFIYPHTHLGSIKIDQGAQYRV